MAEGEDVRKVKISAAVILGERILQEADGVISVVRIPDRIMVTTTSLVGSDEPVLKEIAALPRPVTLNLAVLLRQYDGPAESHTVLVEVTSPDGSAVLRSAPMQVALSVEIGANLISPLNFLAAQDGRYLVTVDLDGETVGVAPVEVISSPPQQPADSSPPSPPS